MTRRSQKHSAAGSDASPRKATSTVVKRRLQVLLQRPSLEVGWGFLTYKGQWPLRVGSVSNDAMYNIAPSTVPDVLATLRNDAMLFSTSSSSLGADAGDTPVSEMPMDGIGVASLKKGDVICGLNGLILSTREDADQIFQRAQQHMTVLVERETTATSSSPLSSSTSLPQVTAPTQPIPPPTVVSPKAETGSLLGELPRPARSATMSTPGKTSLSTDLLADLPRPASATTSALPAPVAARSELPSQGVGSTLPRPPPGDAAVTPTLSALGLPAPPPTSTSPPPAPTNHSHAHVDEERRDREPDDDDDHSESGEDANTARNEVPVLKQDSPLPPRESLELLTHQVAREPTPPSVRGWQDPLRPVYFPPVRSDDAHAPPTAGQGVAGASEGPRDDDDDTSDVLGVRLASLSSDQRAARAMALRRALGASTRAPATAAGSLVNALVQDEDSAAVGVAVRRLPVTVRTAVYDRSGCPFDETDGFTEEFHKAVQSTVTRLALHREDRLPPPPAPRALGRPSRGPVNSDTPHDEGGEASAVDLLLNGRYDLVLYAQTITQSRGRTEEQVEAVAPSPTDVNTLDAADGPSLAAEETQAPSDCHGEMEAVHKALLSVMDTYAAARRNAAGALQEQTRAAEDSAREWSRHFERLMQRLSSRQAQRDDSSEAGASEGGGRSGSKKKRKRSRDQSDHFLASGQRSDRGSHGTRGNRQQRQAYAAMAQLLVQFQGRAQGTHMGATGHYQADRRRQHSPPPVGAQYYAPPAQRERRTENEPESTPTADDSTHANRSTAARVYRPPQFPTARTSDGASQQQAPTSRLGLPAPPPK